MRRAAKAAAKPAAVPISNVIPFPTPEISIDDAADMVAGIPAEHVLRVGFRAASWAMNPRPGDTEAVWFNQAKVAYLAFARVLVEAGRL